MTNIAIENSTLILDLPIQNGDFPQVVKYIYIYIYVSLPEAMSFAKTVWHGNSNHPISKRAMEIVDLG